MKILEADGLVRAFGRSRVVDCVSLYVDQCEITGLKARGISILITDHAAREILQVVDRCYVIDEGRVLCHGTPEEIKEHEDVRRRYLGDIDAA